MKVNFWNDIHAVLMLLSACAALLIASLLPIIMIGFCSFFYFAYLHRAFLASLSPFAGYANWVTLLRLVLVLFAFYFATTLKPLLFGGLLILSVALDAVDGYLARRFNQSSVFGQYFDMEVDALFVLGMCFYYYFFQDVPIWILIPGVLRYLFRLVTMLIKKPDFQEKKKPYAAYIAGLFFGILLLCLVLSNTMTYYLLLFGSGLIIISFSISFWEFFTWKHEHSVLQQRES